MSPLLIYSGTITTIAMYKFMLFQSGLDVKSSGTPQDTRAVGEFSWKNLLITREKCEILDIFRRSI